MLEAFVHGINMSIPYGGWLGNKTKDSFWPPREATKKIGDFLAHHEDLFSSTSYSKVCLFYTFPNLFEVPYLEHEHPKIIYWEIARFFCEKNINYDVLYLNDGKVVPDNLDLPSLEKYSICVLPYTHDPTENQIAILQQYLRKGRKVIVIGSPILNKSKLKRIASESGCDTHPQFEKEKLISTLRRELRKELFIEIDPAEKVGTQLYDIGNNRIAMHILNYDCHSKTGQIIPLRTLRIKLNLGRKITNASIVSFESTSSFKARNNFEIIELENLRIYSVIVFDLI